MSNFPIIKYGGTYRRTTSTELSALAARIVTSVSTVGPGEQFPATASNAVNGRRDEKTDRQRQRVNSELEAALALHKAGMPCKVRKYVVCAVKGWSRATLYRRVADMKFPKPMKDGRNSWWWIADVFDDP